jgi:hypothetical protein
VGLGWFDLTPFIPLSWEERGEYNKKRATALLNSQFGEEKNK